MFEVDTSNSPYYDDYNPEKNFYKILYRPGYAVQTRELNQQQTILQNQIERFGSHVFKDGTIVEGGSFDIEKSVDYVQGSTTTDYNTFVGREVVGEVTGIKARVVHAIEDGASTYLYIRYESATPTDEIFRNDETLFTNDADLYSFTIGSVAADIGTGSIFSISDGILYFNGYFISFPAQKIVLDKFTDMATLNAIFKARFFSVNFNDDPSLLDNAQGSPNFTAPGADRLSAELTLTTTTFGNDLADDEILLFSMDNGFVVENKERTLYSRIYEEVAKRTYDESGDYNVRGMTVFTREHLDTGDNGGRFVLNDGGDSTLLSVGIESGLSYVKGYEIGKLVTSYVDIEKSTDFENVNNQISFARSGNYILIDELTGAVNSSEGQAIDLYNTAEQRRSNLQNYNATATGTKIGTAKVKAALTENKTQIRVYIFNINMNDGYSIADTRAIQSSTFFGDVVLTSNNEVIRDKINDALLFAVGSNHIRTIRTENGTTDTSFVRSKLSNVNLTTAGEFTVSASVNESLPYGTGTLGSLAKDSILLSIESNVQASMTGTIACSGTTVTGSSTSFLTTVNVGERLITTGGTTVTIVSVDSDTQLTVTPSSSFASQGFKKRFIIGDQVVLNGYGGNGLARSITADPSSLTFDLNETFDTTLTGKVIYNVAQNTAQEASKALIPDVYVKIDTSTLTDLNKLNLGFSDVFKVKSIRMGTTALTSETDGDDAYNQFIINNGQQNSIYSHAYLVPKKPLSGTEHILVKLDYFDPDFSGGFGYFSVDSYPVDDVNESNNTIFTYEIPSFKSTQDGNTYDLRNYMDFRPVKANTATNATLVSNATVNPPTTETLVYGANGLGIPTPGSNITYDYSYYLARKDIITLNTSGDFGVVTGKPAVNPRYATISDDVMGVARLYIPPYPSVASTYARILNRESIGTQSTRVTHKRYTMRDIGVIDSRVKTLEYYNALNLLEKSAVDMTVLDENGLDRFKNGFFVDGFLDHSLGAQYNEDYNIVVDGKEQVIRPIFEMDSFKLYNDSISNMVNNNGLITMPFTETSLLKQPNATTIRNIEQSVYRFIGTLEVDPPIDTWVDETTVDNTIQMGDDDTGLSSGMETQWGSWENNVTGYNAYNREYGDRSKTVNSTDDFIGTFSTYEDAVAAANKTDRRTKIETVKVSERTGVKTNVNITKDTEELGNFVTDVSLIPYIRPQKIRIWAKGMKANTKYYVYFDGEDLTSFTTPYTIPESGDIDFGTPQNEGDPIRSDEYGEVLAYIRLPETGKRFRVGTKKIVITDSPTNAKDPSSYAEGYFVASGLKQKRQNTILSTTTVIKDTETVTERGREEQSVEILGPSCMAYSFIVNVPEEEKGVFLTSVDVFIESLHPTLGVWFELREMSSDGGITRTQVPYSEVWMKRDDPRLQTSSDASLPTNVNFKSPVFLFNDTQYAFVIHTEGLNPDTYFFVSRLGEDDLNTGEQITSRGLTGTTYTTNNNLNWDIVPDVDLTIRFNRADFATSPAGTARFANRDYEFITIAAGSTVPFGAGQDVTGTDKVEIGSLTGTYTPTIGDVIYGNTSTTSSNIVDIRGNVMFMDGHGYEQGEVLQFKNSGGTNLDLTANAVIVDFGKAVVRKIDYKHNRLSLDKSNGGFFVGSVISNRSGSTYTIDAFTEFPYSNMRLDSSSIAFKNKAIDFTYRGIDSSTLTMGSYHSIDTENTVRTDSRMAVLSKSYEQLEKAGQKSMQALATINGDTRYTSPIIDDNVMSNIVITNIVNNDITDEDLPGGGDLINKYISKVVTLADNQNAEDLNVYLTAYRPPNTDVKVWARVKNENDNGNDINDRGWIELVTTDQRYSSLANEGDFIEIKYNFPESMMTGTDGVFQYTDSGTTYTGFNQFSIKVGLLSTDSHRVPKAADLRTIALQV